MNTRIHSSIPWVLLCVVFAAELPVARAQLAIIRQGKESSGKMESGDFCGGAVVTGDFNNDGYADVAIGSPFERSESNTNLQTGFVTVNFGSPFGVSWKKVEQFTLFDAGYFTDRTAQMGFALAAGDFNNDGFDDLVVGAPATAVNGQGQAGQVFIFSGGATSMSHVAQVLDEGDFGALIEADDRFGAALAVGRLGTDAYDDLVIGAPGENSGAGAIFIIRGGPLGLDSSQTQSIDGSAMGAPARAGDGLGSALAVGNIVGLTNAEIIVGAPYTDAGIVQDVGMVHVLIGTSTGVSLNNALHYDITATGEFYASNLRFGFSLATGNLWGDGGERDLAIGVPGMVNGNGRVAVARGQTLGLTFPTLLHQREGNVMVPDEADDFFGWALATGDYDGDGIDDLAVGAPGEDDERQDNDAGDNSGFVNLFFGTANGPVPGNPTPLAFFESDLNETPNGNASLGYSLAMGRTSLLQRESIVAGAPLKNLGTGEVFDIAPWRQILNLGCRTAIAADCESNVVYALKPFEHVLIASTTKIMTVLLGCEATQLPGSDPRHVGLNDSYTIESWMPVAFPLSSSCSIFGFAPFDTFTFEELLRTCVMVSGNDSAHAIADAITGEIDDWISQTGSAPMFVQMMNDRAAQIGMNDTLFTNPPGVDDGGPYSSAYDMYLLARTAMKNALFTNIVGTTTFPIDHLVPGTEAGIYMQASDTVSYGWLKALKNRDPRVIGIKPGGTPGAGKTGVVAIRQSVPPNGIAFAGGFGWFDVDSSFYYDELVALAQLAVKNCEPDFQPPGDVGSTLAGASWQLTDTNLLYGFSTEIEPGGGTTNHFGNELTIILYPSAAPPRNATLQMRVNYRTVVPIQGSGWVGMGAKHFYKGHTGITLRNLDPTHAATLSYTATPPGGPPQSLLLAPGQSSLITSNVVAKPNSTNEFQLVINNLDSQDAELGIEARDFLFEPKFDTAYPYAVECVLVRLPNGIHEAIHAWLSTGTPLSPSLIINAALSDPAGGAIFTAPINIGPFSATFSGGTDTTASVGWTSWSQFYRSFAVETTDALGSGASWQTTTNVPAASTGTNTWKGQLKATPQQFVRIRGVLP